MIYEDRIWLGNFQYASNQNFLIENHISTVVSCLELSPSSSFPGISYQKFPIKGTCKDIKMEKMILSNKKSSNFVILFQMSKATSMFIGIDLFT